MKPTLIIATMSYAGMGPYVSGIVNAFKEQDEVYYLFVEDENKYYSKNIKSELRSKSTFYYRKDTKWNKIKDLFPWIHDRDFGDKILCICRFNKIQNVHFINGTLDLYLIKQLEANGIRVAVTVHDLHPHESNKAWYKKLRSKARTRRIHQTIAYCHNLLTNSKIQEEELKKLYPNKYIEFHNFPSLVTPAIINGQKVVSELSGLSKNYILFFGRIEEYKGVRILYDAYNSSEWLQTHYALVIAGKGEFSFNQEKNGKQKNIYILNRYIDDAEIGNLYKHAACVVYPYISATQSGVLSLAFYFQVPTITSDIPYFASIVKESKTGLLFEKGNAKDLEEKICKIFREDNIGMKRNQEEYYARNYHEISIREKLLEIYNYLT